MGTFSERIKTVGKICILAGAVFSRLPAQDVRIGIFDETGVRTFVFHCTSGDYKVYGDSVYFRDIRKGELVYVSMFSDRLVMLDGNLNYASFSHLAIRDSSTDGTFRLKMIDPAREPRNYSGNIEINRFHGSMQIVNILPLDDYLAGVVEAEGGPVAPLEFYKAQAILCRSFAVKNWEKHTGQNFNLCDEVHCQAFMGMNDENPVILEAVTGTHSLVMVDENNTLVSAIFHSNSGGETQRAEDIWTGGEDYLQAVVDPFSLGQKSSSWEKVITREQWKQYLSKHIRSDISKLNEDQLLVRQDHRKKYFIIGKDSLRLADIRNDLQLRSSFFSMEYINQNIIIHGRGYGHGVGMSQEGAMVMASEGYSYADILRFYFYNIQIVELSEVPQSSIPDSFP